MNRLKKIFLKDSTPVKSSKSSKSSKTSKTSKSSKSSKSSSIPDVKYSSSSSLRDALFNKNNIYSKGDLIGNRFLLKKHLGSGTFGEVHMALDKRYNKDVAIKIQKVALSNKKDLNSPLKTDTDLFTKELSILSKLSSECSKFICISAAGLISKKEKEIKEIPSDFCLYYIAMELIDGMTLSDYIDNVKYSDDELYLIFEQLVDGLQAMHKFKIFHSDIKTDNIMLKNDGTIKFVDFGLACDFNYESYCSVGGTRGYMSPEYIKKLNSQDYNDYVVNMDDVHINDWYSLAMVMYELVARKSIHTFNDEDLPKAAIEEIVPMRLNSSIKVFILAGLIEDPLKRLEPLGKWHDLAK